MKKLDKSEVEWKGIEKLIEWVYLEELKEKSGMLRINFFTLVCHCSLPNIAVNVHNLEIKSIVEHLTNKWHQLPSFLYKHINIYQKL